MPKKTNKVFSDAMAAIVREMLAEGGGIARDAALRLRSANPELFDLCRDESALSQWTTAAATLFKRLTPAGKSLSQMVIPGLDLHRLPEMPSAISIPSKDGGAPFFRTLSMATVGELKVCVAGRQKQLNDDTVILRGLRRLLEHRVGQGAGDGDHVFEQAATKPSSRSRRTPRAPDQPGAPA